MSVSSAHCKLQMQLLGLQVCLPKIADCHATIYGGKHRNVAENEQCQLPHRKHGTVKIKDFTGAYVSKYMRGGKGPKIVQNYGHNANVLPLNMLMSSAKTHSLIARLCIAPKQSRIIGTGYFQQFLDLFVMRRRDWQTVTRSLKLFIS